MISPKPDFFLEIDCIYTQCKCIIIIPVQYAIIIMQCNISMVVMVVMRHANYRTLDCFDLPTHWVTNRPVIFHVSDGMC